MTHLPYVAASYGLALLVGVAFAAHAWLRMRRAARRLEAIDPRGDPRRNRKRAG